LAEQDRLALMLTQKPVIAILLFFVLGLGLALTPCVFPMIPILSSIIVGQGEGLTTRKAFTLSLVYVLAMALTYTGAGVIAGLFGENLQAAFQNPWIISSFVAIFALLSLSMFGFYDLQIPSSWQSKLSEISNRQEGGTLLGVGIMGFLSALIVGPCVAAPLAGALLVIGQTGDAVLGGAALFSLSLGMGMPLLAIGTSAGKILPRAGTWMNAIKAVFGVLLLAVGIWMLERIVPAQVAMLLWATLLIISAIYMGALDSLGVDATGWAKLWKGTGMIGLVYGVVLMLGVFSGGDNMWQPLQHLRFAGGAMPGTVAGSEQHLEFKRIKGVEGFNAALAEARQQGKPVMLDFYADWCVECIRMEKTTFANPAVQQSLGNVVALQADVTDNDAEDKALLKHFGLIGPPAILFFDAGGREQRNFRIVGYKDSGEFTAHLERALP
jgi:thiol:disulfide interchange protein DsbD